MDYKKIGRMLLFPHTAALAVMTPISVVFLVASMVFIGVESIIAYVSYALAAYVLTVWCFRIPRVIELFKALKRDNRYVRRWLEDARFRVNVSLYVALSGNVAYGLFQLWLGFYHRSFWYYSMAAYFVFLSIMRYFLVRHTRAYAPGERMRVELLKYRACGLIFLLMNLAVSLMVFFMVYWNRTFVHHEITTIAMAAYTFTAFTAAIVNLIKYRKYRSPIFTATRSIGLASASVSMITLESTMLTTFGQQSTDILTRRILLGVSGGAVCLFIIGMAIFMIYSGTKKLNALNENTQEQ